MGDRVRIVPNHACVAVNLHSRLIAARGGRVEEVWSVAARGRVNKLSFFIHDFMDARGLERERIDACAFMVATAGGMTPMCLHNAKRDDFILEPLRVGGRFWHPLTGDLHDHAPEVGPVGQSPRTLKGRAKARARGAG